MSSSSLASSGDGDDLDSNLGLRSSIDNVIGKVKERTSRRSSVDDRGNSEEPPERRLTTFVAKTKRKIRPNRGDNLERASSTESKLAPDVNLSDSSSLMVSGSGGSSLFTDDDEEKVDSYK